MNRKEDIRLTEWGIDTFSKAVGRTEITDMNKFELGVNYGFDKAISILDNIIDDTKNPYKAILITVKEEIKNRYK